MAHHLLTGTERLLGELIAFDTVSNVSNVACAQLIADRLDCSGMKVDLFFDHIDGHDKVSLLARLGPTTEGGLIVSGHMDVVPFADQPGWNSDALTLTRRGDQLIGRGVSDMKGFLAQAIMLAEGLDSARLRRPLVLLFTCDEEIGCLGAERLLPSLQQLRGHMHLPTDCMIGEPTSFRVFRAHKGHIRLDLTFHGRGGHSSRPDLGANAITAAAACALAIHELGREMADHVAPEDRQLFPDYPAVPFNLGSISGGTASNMIAERCELVVAFRQVPGADPEELIDEVLNRTRAAVASSCPGASVELSRRVVTPAMASPANAETCQELCQLTGEASASGAPFATDGGMLEKIGIRSWICGPGALEQAHQPDEALALSDLDRGLSVLEELINRRCS